MRRACFINNECLAGSVEDRERRGVVIEAKHFKKALRRAYKSTAMLSTTCRTYRGLCQKSVSTIMRTRLLPSEEPHQGFGKVVRGNDVGDTLNPCKACRLVFNSNDRSKNYNGRCRPDPSTRVCSSLVCLIRGADRCMIIETLTLES